MLRETAQTVHSTRPGTGYEATAHYLQDMQLASFGECSGKLHKRYTPQIQMTYIHITPDQQVNKLKKTP